jgi:hypothetical protein
VVLLDWTLKQYGVEQSQDMGVTSRHPLRIRINQSLTDYLREQQHKKRGERSDDGDGGQRNRQNEEDENQ